MGCLLLRRGREGRRRGEGPTSKGGGRERREKKGDGNGGGREFSPKSR